MRVTASAITVDLGGSRILDSVDIDVPPGRWLAVVGPNGAGKSTLLRVIAGVLAPRAGEVTLDGRNASALQRRERARCTALVPQAPIVPPGMAVVDYVMLGRTPYLRPFAAEGSADVAAAHDAMARLDLLALADRDLSSLSGGERQRAFLARALAQAAPVLLLDEPTTALDVGHQQQVLELIDRLRRQHELTVITTLHDLTSAGQYADDLVLLDRGHVVVAGAAHEVLTEEHLARYYGARVPRHRRRRPSGHRPPATSRRAVAMTDQPDPTVPPTEHHTPETVRQKSVVVVNTGDGKGKSTAAFGVLMRGIARGWRVAVVQFLKSGEWKVGEEKVGRDLGADWWALGEGFTWDSDDLSEDEAVAQEAWRHAAAVIAAGEHRLVILDEITYPMTWGWISTDEVDRGRFARARKASTWCSPAEMRPKPSSTWPTPSPRCAR